MLTVALLAFGGCGGEDDSGGNEPQSGAEETAGGLPACSEVWVAGETLPEDYEGCETGDTIEAAVTVDCGDGSKFTSFQDRYWAVLGGEIKDSGSKDGTSSNREYAADYDACLGAG